jgi:hypothetical protein
MIFHRDLTDEAIRAALRRRMLRYAGHAHDKIFGRLDCRSGRRMKRNNRVFFTDQAEAMASGFRPCGPCMRKDYDVWKAEQPCSNPLPRSSKLV